MIVYLSTILEIFLLSRAVIVSAVGRKMVAKCGAWSQGGRKMTARKSMRFPGVQARESSERRYRGRPDVCYTIDYRKNGKRVRQDIGWASDGMTAAKAADIRGQLLTEAKLARLSGELLPHVLRVPTLAEAWERYRRDWLLANGKDVKGCAHLIGHLRPILHLHLNDITAYHLDSVMADMRACGLAAQTIRHAVALVRRIMRRMVKWRLYAGPLPFDEVTLPRPNNARERYLEPEEARALLAELHRRSPQTWLMALISLHCGLRFGEVARLTFGDVREEDRALYIAESKSGRARHAVMTDDVAGALKAIPQGAASDLIFPARGGGVMREVSGAFGRAVDALGLNDTGERVTRADGTVERVKIRDARRRVVFHTLRHTYASWLARSGQGQLVIADRLGHSSLAMTERYTHLFDETRRASAEAISKIFSTHGGSR